MYDYFYGAEADQFSFYRIPKVLFTEERFKSISAEAKVLYGLLLDRMSLSARNGWLDEEGRVYIIFSVEDIMTSMGCANQKSAKLLYELESKCSLIERKRQGLGKPNLIYVKNFVTPSESHFKKCENHDSGSVKITSQESLKSHANNTENNNTEHKIRNGIIQSCGCQRHVKLIKNLTGMKFGKLTALERLDEKIGSSYAWRCVCDCGKETKVSANALLKGGTKSCGCGKIEAVKESIQRYGTVADHQHFVDGTCVERIKSTYKLRVDNKSGHTGIQIRGTRYVAMIAFKQQTYYLGTFERLEDALQVRKKAEKMLFEPFLDWYHNCV